MTQLQIVSDLHLEFRGTNFRRLIKPSAPILCMVGDICACGTNEDFSVYREFIKYIAPKFQYVFHIPGNHEYYASGNRNIQYSDTLPGIDKKIQKFLGSFNNVFFLNNGSVRLKIGRKTYVFIGTALWSEVRPKDRKRLGNMMNDYCSIYMPDKKGVRKYSVDDMSKLYNKALRYILREIKKLKNNEVGVVLTHHKPYRTRDIEDIITQAYETDIIGKYIKQPSRVKLFAYGHTHVADNSVVGGFKVISNPKGYPSQKTLYKPNFSITI